ncbi:proton-coupled folate transporter-like [Lytechinus variegatus]|uniref:proton-coupled folate transporter-like n=1 Tax=Lytechinus variegatus TaxID=7654 RepID=UPI001BB27FE0|nr:proton-coupled folate transporter-like [Lytechinus variegatus]
MRPTRRNSFTSSLDVNSLSTDVYTLEKTGREVARSRWITVEPLLILSNMASAGLLVTRLQYLRVRIAHDKFNQSADSGANESSECDAAIRNSSSIDLQQAIQVQLSLYSLILNALSTFPAIFSTILIGSLSDRIGRRVGLVVPIVGLVIQCALYVAVFYAHLPIWVCFVADTLQGIAGGYGLLLSTASAYIADISTVEQRTWRLVIAEAALVLGSGLIQPINGFIIDYFGMGVAFWTSLGVSLPGLLYAACPLTTPETVMEEAEETLSEYIKDIFRGIYRLLSINVNGRRWKIIVLYIAELFLNTVINGLQIIPTYGLGPPFCWGPRIVGYFTAAVAILPVIGVTAAVKVFAYCMNDLWMIHCGTLAMAVACIVTGVAPSTLYLFIALAPYSVGCLISPVLKGVLSKLVDEHEQGSVFALAGCMVNISQFVGPVLANALYASTVSFYSPLVFYVFAGLLTIPTILNGIVQRYGTETHIGYTRIPDDDD